MEPVPQNRPDREFRERVALLRECAQRVSGRSEFTRTERDQFLVAASLFDSLELEMMVVRTDCVVEGSNRIN